jgi:Tol biopolymer transport system component
MSLQPGQLLLHYRIVDKIGEGGMGAVYRATDTTLGRHVAIKVLPEGLASDPERMARFEREAKVLASLNQPHIASIYGLHEAERVRFLAMEMVEGEDLSRRLARGAIAVDEALPLARQIAEALEHAHDLGIVHRDLKPANIMVRPDGTVKVLDFGLAKIWAPEPASGSQSANSPTLTGPATQAGLILGTAAYMAPEQARGRPVDRRADVWAFGCVLYEMLTGKRAFPGDDVTDILAAIVRGEPDWSALPQTTPSSVRRLLHRSLIKDPKDRLPDVGVARLEIADASGDVDAAGNRDGVAATRTRAARWGWIAAAIAGALLTGLITWAARPSAQVAPVPPERRATVLLPDSVAWTGPGGSGVAISPDGAWLAYTAVGAEGWRLYVQALAEDAPRMVSRSESAYGPFFSPDSTQVGFISRGKLWRMPLSGGATYEIGDIDPGDRGATWAEDGFIYSGGSNGVSRIAPSGGARESLTRVDASRGEAAHRFPSAVPGQPAIVFTVFKGALDEARLAVLDLGTRQWTQLTDLPGHDGRVTPDGRLIYSRLGTLMAAPFDLKRRVLTGAPEPVQGGVQFNNGGATHFAVSATGTLVYISEADCDPTIGAVWARRDGHTETTTLPEGRYRESALSPDGTRVAVLSNDAGGSSELSVWDFGRNAWAARFSNREFRESPIWMPDGQHLVFTYREHGIGSAGRLFQQLVDNGQPQPVSEDALDVSFGSSGQYPGSVTSDGARVFYRQFALKGMGIGVLDLSTRKGALVIEGDGSDPRISPDGRFLAYIGSGPSGSEVYVSPFPSVGSHRWTVSTGGARLPFWSADGRELFYRQENRILGVRVNPRATKARADIDAASPDFSSRPQVVFESARPLAGYAVHRDGQRLLVFQETRAAHPMPHIVFNWLANLGRARAAGER